MPLIEFQAYNGDMILVEPDLKVPNQTDIGVPLINRAELGAINNNIYRRDKYKKFIQSDQLWPVLRGEKTQTDAANEFGCHQNEVSVFARAYVQQLRHDHFEGTSWQKNTSLNKLLTPTPDAFASWRRNAFKTPQGRPYETPPHQMEWVAAILRALKVGGRLNILAPPRHGKTDLLAHFCVWMILINPNIRIIWIGGNKDIAEASSGQVRDLLENNEYLKANFLRPGELFKPERSEGKSWTDKRFTVATRTITGLRSPTMLAVGRGSKILSRDADMIITDDIEDYESTKTEGSLKSTKEYLQQNVNTRKEEHTAWINIGSRQHVDDVHGYFMRLPTWKTIVNRAHDPACELPEHDEELPPDHADKKTCEICDQHIDCVLFPSLRTFKFLMDQKNSMTDEDGNRMSSRRYEMVYNNNPEAAGSLIFLKKSVDDCLNRNRRLGDMKWLERNVDKFHIIGGLDPSATGFQASVLKAYNPESRMRYIVDLENRRGGGIKAAREIIAKWFETYNLRYWIIEENLYHGGLIEDEKLQQYAAGNGIDLRDHQTNAANKWDQNWGITGMGPLFDEGLYDIPWANPLPDSIRDYRKQLLTFQKAETSKKRVSDLVMADWFTEVGIRNQGWHREIEIIDESATYPYPTGYGEGYESLLGSSLTGQ